MSNQEHTPRGSEPEPAPDHQETADPQVVDPDDVQLSDAEVSREAVEPELTVTADDVQLAEPSLNPAVISEDTAKAASLEETAAEARRVEQEALDAGKLVAGGASATDPTSKAAPAGTAPAGGAAGDVTDAGSTDPDEDTDISERADTGDHGDTSESADTPDSTEELESTGAPVSTDATRALPDFAAESPTPDWTPAATDEQKWDRLFEEADPESNADAPGPVSAAAAASEATEIAGNPAQSGDTPVIETVDAEGTADPASLPAGMAAPPSGSPTPEESPAAEPADEPAPEPAGGPYGLPPAGTRRRDSRAAPEKPARNKNLLLGGILLGLLALGLLIWGVITIVGGLSSSSEGGPTGDGTAGADGIIAENVMPIDVEAGQCLRDFTDINSASTVVTCSTPHNAQLLATELYADDDEFPGDDALAIRAQEVCDSVDLNESAAGRYENLELLRVTPRQGAWDDGDRRVDCLVTSSEGNVIGSSLLTE